MIALSLTLLFAAADVEHVVPARDVLRVRTSGGATTWCANATDAPWALTQDDVGIRMPRACTKRDDGFVCATNQGARRCAIDGQDGPPPDVYVGEVTTSGLDDELGELVRGLVTGALRTVDDVRVGTAADLTALLDEAAREQASGCAGDTCLASVARLVGARFAATAAASHSDGALSLSLSLLDGRTARAVAHETLVVRHLDDLSDALDVAAHNLFVPLTGRGRRAAPIPLVPLNTGDPAALVYAASAGGVAALALWSSATALALAGGASILLAPDGSAYLPIVAQLFALVPLAFAAPLVVAAATLGLRFLADLFGPAPLEAPHLVFATAAGVVTTSAALFLVEVAGIGLAALVMSTVVSALVPPDEIATSLERQPYLGMAAAAFTVGPALVGGPMAVAVGLTVGAVTLGSVAATSNASDFE